MRRPLAALLAFVFTALPLAAQPQPRSAAPDARALAITGVSVVDVERGRVLRAQTVVLRGDRIVAVGPSQGVRVPAGARRIDGRGKFLVPGLWDMHVHLFNNSSKVGTDEHAVSIPAFIANGVTGVRDMWTDREDLALARRWNEEAAAGALLAPRIFGSSSIVDGVPTSWQNVLTVRDAAEARRAVDSLADAGAPFIKVYESLSRDAYFAIAARAKERGIPFAGHVPVAVKHLEAARAGQRSIEHLAGGNGNRVLSHCSAAADSARVEYDRLRTTRGLSPDSARVLRRGGLRSAIDRFDSRDCAPLFAAYVRHGTWQVPTLVQSLRFGRVDDSTFTGDPRAAYVSAADLEGWRRSLPPTGLLGPEDFALLRERFRASQRLVGAMHRAGVPLLAGTDVGNPYVYPGFSLHDELALLVESGLTPAAALRAATVAPARFLGVADSLGTVAAGKRADLVLLDANPLVDIAGTRRIAAVVTRGRYLDRAALDTLLAEARAATGHE